MHWPGVLVLVGWLGCATGCTDELPAGPFDGLPLDVALEADVSAPIHIARDRTGVAHVYAERLGDAAFAQGYVMAHDRLPQMDVLRHHAAGRLAELNGVADPTTIDRDLELRMHRLRPLAEATWQALRSSRDADDLAVAELLERFAAGVNRYVDDVARAWWTRDPEIDAPADFAPWTPIDSLMIARLYMLAQSWTVPDELDATALYDGLRTAFDAAPPSDAAAAARHGISRDLWRLAPVGRVATLDGLPNLASDTGSRSDASAPEALPIGLPTDGSATRPQVPTQVLADARAFFGDADRIENAPFGRGRGNAWAFGPPLTRNAAVLAADVELPLTEPALFYPTHLIVTGDPADPAIDPAQQLTLWGATVPGIPGVLFGANRELAWAGIASGHDVNDVYLEHIAPCSATPGDCVAWTEDGIARDVPIETFTEEIRIGTRGAIVDAFQATYEVAPHHGPIIPTLDRATHRLVPRRGDAALSIRATADQATFELRGLLRLARATGVTAGLRALDDLAETGQSITMIGAAPEIAWSTHARIPLRAPAAYRWDPAAHQDQLAPFLVLPGTGEADWLPGAALSPRFIPHAIHPPQGYVVSANGDPVGATFDGLVLDQGSVEGQPLYLGVHYAAGFIEERITAQLRDRAQALAGAPVETAAAIQRDTRSNVGAALTPALVTALGRLDRQPIGPPDVNPYLDALPAADLARLAQARALLSAWTFATPAAAASDTAEATDSAATLIFHTWMHFFVERALRDELDAIGFELWRLDDDPLVRLVYALWADPRSFVTSPSTQQPILCDNYRAAGPDDSCTKVLLQAMVDAMTYLESAPGSGTGDIGTWWWGARHRVAIGGADGIAWSGDNSSVSRTDPTWRDPEIAQRRGASAFRWIASTGTAVQAALDGRISVKWSLPGGVIYDHRTPHHRDLLDGYLSDALFDAAISLDEIVAAGESRWVFH